MSDLKNASGSIATPAAWVALVATTAAIVFLACLHVLSPEFDPSWRMVSEYAFGHYGWVLSLMFLSWGVGTWALAVAISSQVAGAAGRVGLVFLVIAGLGEGMASYLDINHPIGHGIAGLLGIFGFIVAALLLSVALRRNEAWRGVGRALLWLANLSWISVVLLAVTLAIMTMQVEKAMGGHLPQHAPKALPAGVMGLDGWADRLLILVNCAWVLVAAWQAARDKSRSILDE